MKKLLTLISAVGMGATGLASASNVVSCSKKDDKKDDKKMNEGDKLLVTISGDSVAKFGDTPVKTKDDKEVIKVEVGAVAKVDALSNVKADLPKLSEILSGDNIKDITVGSSVDAAKDIILKAIKDKATDVVDTDITIEKEATIDTLITPETNVKTIDVPNGEYGIENSKPWILKDDKSNQSDVDRYKGYILKKANKAIDDTEKTQLLTLTNTDVVFDTTLNEKTGVPEGATLVSKVTSGSDVIGFAGSVHVTFTLLQNIQPSGFEVAKNAQDKAKFTEQDNTTGKATLEIIKGKNIAITDKNVDITKWHVDVDFTVKDTSIVAAADASDGLGLMALGAVGKTTTIEFINKGFKKFDLTVKIVEALS